MLYSVNKYFLIQSLKNVDSGVGKTAHWVEALSHTNFPDVHMCTHYEGFYKL